VSAVSLEIEGTERQAEFWASGARFKAFVGGVGSGKTWAGAVEVWDQPARSTGMILAPTYPMLRDATLRTFLDLSREAGVLASFSKSELKATLVNGTTAIFRSADDPERLRGPNLGWFWMDEAALMQQMTWLIMIGRLRERPGRAWATTTPKGKNWLYTEFSDGTHHKIIQASSRTNIYLPDGFLASLDASYSPLFARQEVEGDWIDESHDLLIPTSWIDRSMLAVRPVGVPTGTRRIAVDLAKGTGRDRTVAYVADDLGLLALVASNTVDLTAAANLVHDLSVRFGVRHEQIIYDAGGWAGPDFARYLDAVGVSDATPYLGSASGGHRFKNRRARAAWALRQRLDPDRQVIHPPPNQPLPADYYPAIVRATPDKPAPPRATVQPPFGLPVAVLGEHADGVRRELSELRYTYDGKTALETKDDMTARLGHSPDLADGLIMLAALWGVE
jgi:hypothetical protein